MATDAFTRANETPIGSPWFKSGATARSLFNLDTNEAKGSGGGSHGGYSGTFANDQYAQCKMKGSAWDFAGPCVRMTPGGSGADAMYGFWCDAATMYFYVRASDGYTQQGANVVQSIVADDVLKVTITGTTLEGFLNGTSKGTRTVSGASSGQPGLHFNDASGRVDDFEGADIGGGATIPIFDHHYRMQRVA